MTNIEYTPIFTSEEEKCEQLFNNRGIHYRIPIADDKKICYVHIRKNATSAFQNLVHQSLNANHSLRYMECYKISPIDIEDYQFKIFVYRNPYDRVLSLFINKFIGRTGHTDLFSNYINVTGKDPNEASFCDFVELYLSSVSCCADWINMDLHVLPQKYHLFPCAYNWPIHINEISLEMSKIIGAELSEKFFSKKVNSSNSDCSDKCDNMDIGANTPSNILHDIYKNSGNISKESLFSQSVYDSVCEIYDMDMEMISEIEKMKGVG